MTRYTVVWPRDAEDDLADIWVNTGGTGWPQAYQCDVSHERFARNATHRRWHSLVSLCGQTCCI